MGWGAAGTLTPDSPPCPLPFTYQGPCLPDSGRTLFLYNSVWASVCLPQLDASLRPGVTRPAVTVEGRGRTVRLAFTVHPCPTSGPARTVLPAPGRWPWGAGSNRLL